VTRVHVVGNRSSPEALTWLRRAGHEVIELAATSVAESIAAIREAVGHDNAERIIVIGGDGMVHAAVNAIASLGPNAAHVVLGIIPLGSGNDFARAVDLPTDQPAAAAARALEPGVPVDLLRTTHGWVATVATCGFPARVNKRANNMRFPKGESKYTLATLALVPTLRCDRLTFVLDDEKPETLDVTIVAVGNTAWFGGGMQICPGASAFDGSAQVVRVRQTGRTAMLRYLPTVFDGAHIRNPRTTTATARHVHIDGDASVELWGDGEYMGPLPVDIEVVANAICVAGISRPQT
jgi:diacylglycerol kinase (ATP)